MAFILPDTRASLKFPAAKICRTLSNVLGKQVRKRTQDSVTFEYGSAEKRNSTKMTKEGKMRFVSVTKPHLQWGSKECSQK